VNDCIERIERIIGHFTARRRNATNIPSRQTQTLPQKQKNKTKPKANPNAKEKQNLENEVCFTRRRRV
jgi:hypothetical protein